GFEYAFDPQHRTPMFTFAQLLVGEAATSKTDTSPPNCWKKNGPVTEFGKPVAVPIPLVWWMSLRPQQTTSVPDWPTAQVCSPPAAIRLNLNGTSTRTGAVCGTSMTGIGEPASPNAFVPQHH